MGRLVSEEDSGLMEAGRTVKGSVSAGWHVPLCVAVFFDNRLAWPTGVDPAPLLRQPSQLVALESFGFQRQCKHLSLCSIGFPFVF